MVPGKLLPLYAPTLQFRPLGLLNGAPIEFERVADAPEGGVLFALPALLLYGLLDKSREIFLMPEGFYPLESIRPKGAWVSASPRWLLVLGLY